MRLQATAAVISGWGSDMLIRAAILRPWCERASSSPAWRDRALFAGAALTNGAPATVLLVASGFTVGLSGTMVFTIGQTLAGPRAGGRWMGFQNMVGNFSGIAAPIVTGIVVDWSGSFAGAFLVAAALSAVGILSWWLVVQKVQPVDWSSRFAVAPQELPALAL